MNNINELTRKVMFLEFKLEDYLKRDKFIGKGSRVDRIFNECNALWSLLEAQGRRLRLFGSHSTPQSKEPSKRPSVNPY